jgi:hypothetical protein
MTDRIAALTVILDREYRDDDVQHIVDAIQMTKGVMKVELGPVADMNHYMAKEQVVWAIRKKLFEVLDPKNLKLKDG